ncbi:cytidylyltransferase domain-containing protein [Serratia fonticola]|uniref:acylneuraminate cytidylyltransferase family protein n=1 Tax=Serratia fonticola TaxID=47917 RepID=UPI003BB50AD9
MLGDKRVLAIIPARGGSKRLPRKNLLEFCGKPLVVWSIDAAINSKYIDSVVVSTDDEEIAKVSLAAGAEIPFIRPVSISGDISTSNSVLMHAIENVPGVYDIVVLLQPTSPLRMTSDIDNALQLLHSADIDGVISVCECEHSPLWSNTIVDRVGLQGFIPDSYVGMRSQDLPKYYRFNGSIYAFTTCSLMLNRGIHYSASVYPFTMDTQRSIDIDNKIDFITAETIMKNYSVL